MRGSPSRQQPTGLLPPPSRALGIKEFRPLQRARQGSAPPPCLLLKKGNENFMCRTG